MYEQQTIADQTRLTQTEVLRLPRVSQHGGAMHRNSIDQTTTVTPPSITALLDKHAAKFAFAPVVPTATSFRDSRWPNIADEPSHIHIARPSRAARTAAPTALAG